MGGEDKKSIKPTSIKTVPDRLNVSQSFSFGSDDTPSTDSVVAVSISPKTLSKSSRSNELGRVTNWLEAMSAASPPRVRHTKVTDFNGTRQLLEEAHYLEWVESHPSAMGILRELAKTKNLVLFLDYDGTLAPIVDDPDQAYMSDEMRLAVKEVAKYVPTTIISGRRRDKVCGFVQLPELFYAGSHGMDIVGPAESCDPGINANGVRIRNEKGNELVYFQPASEFLPMINEAYKALCQYTKNILGAKVEHNKFCISVHFRTVQVESWKLLAEVVHYVMKSFPKLNVTQGRKVLEIRPPIQWNKGKAVEFFLKSLVTENADFNSISPIYIGDDKTDEDAFHVVNQKHNGFSILVSSEPKVTSAAYSLQNTSEVKEFLCCLVKGRSTF